MKSPNQRDILVVIPLFNGELWIEPCLKSVLGNSESMGIVVIDNASTDGGVDLIRKQFINVRLIQNHQNMGFGRAVNIGFEIAKKEGYKTVLVLNQDVELNTDSIATMIQFTSTLNPNEWSLVSPIHLDASGKQPEYYFAKNLNEHAHAGKMQHTGDFKFQEVDFINAACWLVNVDRLQMLGGFNPRFFMYGEDLDFCNRSKWLGLKMYLLHKAHCIHHKTEGDYEGDAVKLFALKIGEQMAWYLNPSIGKLQKLWNFIKVTLVSMRFMFSGKWLVGFEKCKVNLAAVRRSFF